MVVGVQAASEPGVPSRFRGRQAEIETPCDQLNAVRAGRGDTVPVAGLAGLCKTVLLDAAAVMARDHGIGVYGGTGDAAERVIPFGPLLGVQSGELSTRAHAALGRREAAGALKVTLTPLGENAFASALRELTARVVKVSGLRRKLPAGDWKGGWRPGPDPARSDYASFADFTDPDSNTSTIQEIGHHPASGAAR
jgi:hypothetical protein